MKGMIEPLSRTSTSRWFLIAIPVAAVLVACGYLLASQLTHGIGFPLDDAWIHQVYARNLVEYHEWSFVPGVPSAGSTSPLWSLMVGFGYLIQSGPFLWTFTLGTLSLAGIGLVGEKWMQDLRKGPGSKWPLAAFFLIGEWHLAWSAVSGMETIFFALLILAFFYFLNHKKKEWLAGLLIGISIWVRPDGLTLLGPAIFLSFLDSGSWKERFIKILRLIFPVLLLAGCYFAFNLLISNTWLPNTFFAKQAEYAVYQDFPLLERIIQLGSLPLIGPGLFLVPGFIFFAWKAIKQRNWAHLGMLLWWFGYILIYAMRLPVTYQHGRYLIPSMPVFFLVGMSGTIDLLQKLRGESPNLKPGLEMGPRLRRLGAFGWSVGIAILSLVMTVFGAAAYAQDVAIIDTEMVSTAKWVDVNIPAGAIVGAHDIGALGYFGGRKILDLAGLVSPAVVPFIRDEKALSSYLTQNEADYLMTFPEWYPELVKEKTIVFRSGGTFSPAAGGENMEVFRWP
jgi:hypothetical protein